MPTVSKPYKASLSKTQGRQSYSIIFRHPVRKDPNTGKPGRRVRAGLGTKDETEASQLVNQMNELLANSDFWTIGAQATARGRFDTRIVDVFFHDIVPQPTDFMSVREQVIPIPSSGDSDYRSALLLGTTGAGKTTVLRQIIGTHPVKERFPSTSTAKTTVADTEIIVAEGDYQAVITFMERDEVQDYLGECISKAVLTAYQGKPDSDVLRSLLQHVDQRIRFNYVLGSGLISEDDLDDEDEDDLDEALTSSESELAPEAPEGIDLERTNELLDRAARRASEIANNQGAKLKAELDATDESDKRVVDELFEEELDRLVRQDEEYHTIADELMDEIELRFSALTSGLPHKTKQGWPVSWEFSSVDRSTFIKEMLRFSSNHAPLFGRLLTPLVNGIRVKGPFFPAWAGDSRQPIVIIDGEGLGHNTPDSSSSLSTSLLRRIDMVDAVILVDNATQPMQAATVAALRSLIRTGNIKKLLMCFTHFDEVKGDNLPTVSAKRDHVLASAENVMTRLGEDLGLNAKRALRAKLAEQCYFLGGINKILDAKKQRGKRSIEQMQALLTAVVDQIVERAEPAAARPVYDRINLTMAIHKAAVQFRQAWCLRLGLEDKPGINKEHWTRVKALNRDLANGWSDEYDNLRPVSDLHKQLGEQIYITIQNPIRWEGDEPDKDSKQQTYDDFYSALTGPLLELATQRVWTERADEWQKALNQSGRGSTVVRARIIAEEIYDKAAPVPGQKPSPDRNKFVHEVLALVKATCEKQKIRLK